MWNGRQVGVGAGRPRRLAQRCGGLRRPRILRRRRLRLRDGERRRRLRLCRGAVLGVLRGRCWFGRPRHWLGSLRLRRLGLGGLRLLSARAWRPSAPTWRAAVPPARASRPLVPPAWPWRAPGPWTSARRAAVWPPRPCRPALGPAAVRQPCRHRPTEPAPERTRPVRRWQRQSAPTRRPHPMLSTTRAITPNVERSPRRRDRRYRNPPLLRAIAGSAAEGGAQTSSTIVLGSARRCDREARRLTSSALHLFRLRKLRERVRVEFGHRRPLLLRRTGAEPRAASTGRRARLLCMRDGGAMPP